MNGRTGERGAAFLIHTLLAAVIALFSAAGLLPPVRTGLVAFIADNYMHRSLNMNYWTQQLFALAFIVFAMNLIVYLALRTGRGRTLCRKLSAEMGEKARLLRDDRKPLVILFAIYTFGMISVIRADIFYGGADDLYRSISGARAWRNFYRYVSHFLSIFVHTSPRIFDIAPLTQFIALAVMALSALVTIRVFLPRDSADKGAASGAISEKLSPMLYVAAVPLVLFPYFLENLSYRYDSPYMALSVLFCVLPFLFTRRLVHFALVSLTSLFLMCLSYQAASGVYIVACSFFVFDMWCRTDQPLSRVLRFTLTAVACYALALLIFFALFNVQPVGDSYVDKNLNIAAFPTNIKAYLSQIWEDYGTSSLKLSAIILVPLFTMASCLTSRRNKWLTAFVSLLLVVFATVFSYGAFLVMGRPLLEPRSMFPFGFVVALMALRVAVWLSCGQAARKRLRAMRFACRAVLIILSYSCMAYAFAYGNAHASQKKYTNFRVTLLLEDLSRVIPPDQEDVSIHVLSDIDFTLAVKTLERTYPVATRMIENMGGHAVVFYLQDYGLGVQAEENKYTGWQPDLDGYELAADNRYHSIYARDNDYFVIFREPSLTLRE